MNLSGRKKELPHLLRFRGSAPMDGISTKLFKTNNYIFLHLSMDIWPIKESHDLTVNSYTSVLITKWIRNSLHERILWPSKLKTNQKLKAD